MIENDQIWLNLAAQTAPCLGQNRQFFHVGESDIVENMGKGAGRIGVRNPLVFEGGLDEGHIRAEKFAGRWRKIA